LNGCLNLLETMRLQCEVLISDHKSCIKRPGKPAFSHVSVGRKPGHMDKDSPVYLMLCTAQNRSGSKYIIHKNLMQIFGKFVKDGKATIRFNSPPHDLALSKATPDQLSSLLRIVMMVSKGRELSNKDLSSLAPVSSKQVERPVTNLMITKPSEYPMSFPATLTSLVINGCRLKRLSPHITKLVNLQRLDLSSNQLSSLPDQVANLQMLFSVVLKDNKFCKFPTVFCNSDNSKLLLDIDLSFNEIRFLPSCLSKLKRLGTLFLQNNILEVLPACLGQMSALTNLSVSNNKLHYLPGSLLNKTFVHADFSHNDFTTTWIPLLPPSSFKTPNLAEWAAKAIIKHNVSHTPEDLDWFSLQYLNTASFCLCGQACFESRGSCIRFSKVNAVQTYITEEVPFLIDFCSLKCSRRF